MSKKISARIGAGTLAVATVVAGLSFGPAAVAAEQSSQATTQTQSPSARAAQGRAATASDITITQTTTPTLTAGQTGQVVFTAKNNASTAFNNGGLSVTFVAPTGTTFADTNFTFGTLSGSGVLSDGNKKLIGTLGGWGIAEGSTNTVTANIKANTPLTQTGPVNDGFMQVNTGVLAGRNVKLGYDAEGTTSAADVVVSQKNTPLLAAGQTAQVVYTLKNNGTSTFANGNTSVTFVAPAGTTFADDNVIFNGVITTGTLSDGNKKLIGSTAAFGIDAGGSREIVVSVKANTPLTQGGTINDGFLQVNTGLLAGRNVKLGYSASASASDVVISQTTTPTLSAGQSGQIVYTAKNNAAIDFNNGGISVTLSAPAGTTFADNKLSIAGLDAAGVLSDGNKKLIGNLSGFGINAGGSRAITANLKANTPLTQAGTINDGFLQVNTGLLAGRNVKLGYTAAAAASDIVISQTTTPTLSAGQNAQVVFTAENNSATDLANTSTNVTLVAPAGTTFANNQIIFNGVVGTGTLSEGNTKLVGDIAAFGIDAGGSHQLVANIKANTPLTQSGTVNDGFVRVNTGLLAGRQVALGYVATASVTAPVVNPVAAGDNVLSGTGTPGSTVIVKDKNGDQVGSALVGADGKWTVTVPPTYGPGKHDFDVIATKDGQESTSTPVTVDFGAPIAVTTATPDAKGVVTYTGTGQPGASIEVKGKSGRTLATATVGADGKWTAVSTIALAPQAYVVDAFQTTGIGVQSAAEATFTIKAPTATPVTFTSPARGSLVNTKTPTFSGTGEPGANIKVGGTVRTVGETTVKADGTWTVTSNVALAIDSYALRALQTPTNGAPTSTDTNPFRIGYAAATSLQVTGPAANSTVAGPRPVFSGTGVVGATITVAGPTRTVAVTKVGADGTWSAPASVDLAKDPYTLTVTQDGADTGDMQRTTVHFTVR